MLSSILFFFAGIGVFLFAIKMLSASIESLAGNKIRQGFTKIGKNPFASAGLGFGITFALQSSTASLVMTMGFLSLGIVSLVQAIGFNLGANIASSATMYVVSLSSFSIVEVFCALAVVGAVMQLVSKKEIVRKTGNAIIAFSLLFISLRLMSQATSSFRTDPNFLRFFTEITNPVLLIFLGIAFTCVLQSAMGSFAVIIALLGTGSVAGVLSFESAVFLIYGSGIGTALTTALFGGLTTGIEGKRLAVFHVAARTFNVIIFSLITVFTPYLKIFDWISEPAIRLATIDILMNIVLAIILLPLIKPISLLLMKIMPGKKYKASNEFEIVYIEGESRAVSFARANDKCLLFYKESQKLFNRVIDFIVDSEKTDASELNGELNQFVDYVAKLNGFIAKIPSEGSTGENLFIDKLMIITNHIDRHVRHCLKIMNHSVDDSNGKKIVYSNRVILPVNKLAERINAMIDICEPYVSNLDFDFKGMERPNFLDVLEIKKDISDIKLSVKTNIIKSGFGSKLSIRKNTNLLNILNYMTVISDSILDFSFALETEVVKKFNGGEQEMDLFSLASANENVVGADADEANIL